MLSSGRILIVEEMFLIALDIQRILEDAGGGETVLARNFEEANDLPDGFKAFDLAIVSAPRPGTSDVVVTQKLADAGVALVICSATLSGSGEIECGEHVNKPFSDFALVDACARALRHRQYVS